jgi:putative transcriptional regulator
LKKKHVSLKNHLLIAMPSVDDVNFEKTVIYVCEHSALGAMGLVINRPLQVQLSEIWDELEIPYPKNIPVGNIPVFDGGPLEKSRGFVLYTPIAEADLPEDAQPIPGEIHLSNNLAITASNEMLKILAAGEGPKDVFFALGYAEWDAGQLEDELLENSWLHVPASPRILFHVSPESRLRESAKLIGVDLRALSLEVGHA